MLTAFAQWLDVIEMVKHAGLLADTFTFDKNSSILRLSSVDSGGVMSVIQPSSLSNILLSPRWSLRRLPLLALFLALPWSVSL